MKKVIVVLVTVFLLINCASKPAAVDAQSTPRWITNLDREYPSRDWVAVVAEGSSQPHAENLAMNALARVFKTDVEGLTQASQQFSQIVSNAAGSRSVSFDQSQNFAQEVNTYTNVRGLIGVELDVHRAKDGTVYVCARMNRKECAARYSGMIRENVAIINRLIAAATPVKGSLEVYARLSFAHAIAQVTDNFQNILEVLDPSAANNRPGYGGANAIKAKMLECAGLITIGVAVTTEQAADRTLFTRAAGSFFRDLGFKINENGQGNYILKVNARFEMITQRVISCRYYLDAALTQSNGTSLFSFTEDDRKSHPNTDSEARRLAVRAVEESFKEGQFATEFENWLGGLID